MSRTGSGVRSGYWTVIGRRARCESVMDRPCQKDTTVSLMAPAYVLTVMVAISPLLPSPVGGVDAIADRRAVALRRPEEEHGEERADHRERDAGRRTDDRGAGGEDLPEERRDEADEREGHEVLPAEDHHLVDADAGQRPADPHDQVQHEERLHDEDTHRQGLQAPPAEAGEGAGAARRLVGLG